MLLTVIVPTCNRNELLLKCLDSLSPANQTIDPRDYEIIVTDDSLNNLAKSIIENKYNWVKWVEGSKKGPAANRNNGSMWANGEWLIFIDDDCLADKNILLSYKTAILNSSNDSAFEGAIIPDDWSLTKKDLAECPINTEGNCFWTANVCVKRTLFRKIRGFDESYLLAAQEDQQMKIDIEQAINGKIRFLNECKVIHPVRFTTIKKLIKKIPAASKNFSLYASKNRKILGYTTTLKFFLMQMETHCRVIFNLIKSGKLKSLLVSLVWLIVGVPLTTIYFMKLRRNKS